MSALSQTTSKVRLGQMCTCNSYRNPAYLTKVASNIDVMSNGRLEYAIGAGWYDHEYKAYGYEYPSAGVRLKMLEESLIIYKLMTTEESPTFKGTYYQIDGAINQPKPIQKPYPPLWVCGGGEKVTLKLLAKYGDYGNWDVDVEGFIHKSNILKEHCVNENRDFNEIGRTLHTNVLIGETKDELDKKIEKLTNTGLIILDEVHYLGDTERGTTWEEILIHADLDIKFLCLSATIKNKNEFLEWIVSLRGPTSLIENNQRPVPLEISLVTSNKISNNIKILKSTNKKKDNNNSKLSKLTQNSKKPNLDEQINYLEDKSLTPCIFFYFSRERVESKARQLANKRKVVDEHKIIRDKFHEIFDDLELLDHSLLNLDEHLWMWSRGVAFHHAGLAPIVKEFIEFLFVNKYINFLFATETLALGINMPAKSIYLDRLNKYDGIKTRLISQSEFLQLTGRAGRRGIDDKGSRVKSQESRIKDQWSRINDQGSRIKDHR